MLELHLAKKSQEAYDNKEYVEALRLNLTLRQQRLDLVDTWDPGGDITTLRLCDVDQNGILDIGALTCAGKLLLYRLVPDAEVLASLPDARCLNFRFFQKKNQPAVLVAADQRGATQLSAYNLRRDGARTFFVKIGDLNPQISDAAVLDIACRGNLIYVATSSRKVLRYDAITLKRDRSYSVPGNVTRIITGSTIAKRLNSPVMEHNILGIMEGGGLLVIHLEGPSRVPISPTGNYIDALVADSNNDGMDDIVAISGNGRLDIFDWDQARLKYSFTCADEFYSMSCDDIDGDGALEILVGARSNRIYAFGVGPDRELCIKAEYETDHRVRDLWAGDIQPDDKRLVAGLASGGVRTYQIPPTRTINRDIANAYRELRHTKTQTSIVQILAESANPELARFALDELTPEMETGQIIDLIARIEQTGGRAAATQVLMKLVASPGRFLADPASAKSFLGFLGSFLERFFAKYNDLPACELICSAQEAILRQGGAYAADLLPVADRFNRERRKRQLVCLDRRGQIRELIAKGKYEEASSELEGLQVVGIDALWTESTRGWVSFVHLREDLAHVAFATSEGLFDITSGEPDRPPSAHEFRGSGIRCCATNASQEAFVIAHGRTVSKYHPSGTLTNLAVCDSEVRCLTAHAAQGRLVWAAGTAQGNVLLHDSNGVRAELALEEPAQALCLAGGMGLNLYIASTNGRLFWIQDVTTLRQLASETAPLHGAASRFWEPGTPVNVLDCLAAEGPGGEAVVAVLSPTELCIARRCMQEWTVKVKRPDRSFTCAALARLGNDLPYGIVVGTRQGSLLIYSFPYDTSKEIYLPDVPTALHAAQTAQGTLELAVGYARGTVGRLRIPSDDELGELRQTCQNLGAAVHQQRWDSHDYAQKLVLLSLTKNRTLDLGGIHGALGPRVGAIVPKLRIATAVKHLEHGGLLSARVTEANPSYSIADSNYSEWLSSTQELFRTLHCHKDEVVHEVSLLDLSQTAARLETQGGFEWMCEFLLLDRGRWNKLLALSRTFNRLRDLASSRSHAVLPETASLRQAAAEFLCVQTEAMFKKPVSVPADVTDVLSAFEIRMPSVRFQGFDNILLVLLGDSPDADLCRAIEWLGGLKGWRILILISPAGVPITESALVAQAHKIVLIGHSDLKEVILAASPREALLDLMIKQINLSALSPFQTAGAVDEEMFYGRLREREVIVNACLRNGATCHAIVGPRRIGKTSLLKKVLGELRGQDGILCAFMDCSVFRGSVVDWCNGILGRLAPGTSCSSISEFMPAVDKIRADRHCRLVLLLDEVDDLVATDVRCGRQWSTMLRALINGDDVKVVIAGYRLLYEQMSDIKSPFFNLFEKCELSSLDREAALSLVEEPFRNVIRAERRDMERILEKTGSYPNFIQFCCEALLCMPQVQAARAITRANLDDVIASPELYEHFISVYLENLDEASKLVLYLLVSYYDPASQTIITNRAAHERALRSSYGNARRKFELSATFTPYDLHGLLERHKVFLRDRDLDVLMKRLVLATVLKRDSDGCSYSFVLPDMPTILRGHVEVELKAVSLLESLADVLKRGEMP